MARYVRQTYTAPASFSPLTRARSVIQQLTIKAGAVSVILLCLYVLLAFATHSINDPSLNVATGRTPTNNGGAFGAVLADFFLQSLGAGALLLPLAPCIWGILILAKGTSPATRFIAWIRFIAWGAGILAMAGFAAILPRAADWPFVVGMGGFLGDPVLNFFSTPLMFLSVPGAKIIGGGMAFITSVFLTTFAICVRWAHLHAALQAAIWIYDELVYRVRLLFYVIAQHFFQDTEETQPEDNNTTHKPPFTNSAQENTPPTAQHSAPVPASENDDAPKRKIIRKTKKASQPSAKIRETQPNFPSLRTGQYQFPSLNLIAMPGHSARKVIDDGVLEQNARMLETVLADFGVRGEIINVRPGPVVTLYELEPAAGVKSSRVISLADDIARSMSAIACRVAVVPGRNAIGIELPNLDRETVYLREMLGAPAFSHNNHALTLGLGKNIGGEPEYADLARMPHLLIAGTTGSGKSVGINTMILSLLYRLPPDQCKLIMIDPKMLELSVYEGIPHLLAPVVTDPHKAVVALKWTVKEMEERYQRMSKLGVRNINGFNERIKEAEKNSEALTRTVHTGYAPDTGEPIYESEKLEFEKMPYIVVVIDEVADLMMVAGKDIEGMVQRLAQMARAAGIHLIMATQRPSVDVITGTIKANFPTRISFQVTSKIDSRTILGEQGAEQLLGQGDMLFMAGGGRLKRVHGAFVTDEEVEKIVKFLKKQGKPDYIQEVTEMAEEGENGNWASGLAVGGNTSSGDALYDKALAVVLRDRKASTSYIQRRLQIGYNRAATLIERMEQEGVISSPNHAGKREILLGNDAA